MSSVIAWAVAHWPALSAVAAVLAGGVLLRLNYLRIQKIKREIVALKKSESTKLIEPATFEQIEKYAPSKVRRCPSCGGSGSHHNTQGGSANVQCRACGGSGFVVGRPSSQASRHGSGCFVATAVYGDAEAFEVQVLRHFRDDILRQNRLGRVVVAAYYSGAGRAAARMLSSHARLLMPIVRYCLDSVIILFIARGVRR